MMPRCGRAVCQRRSQRSTDQSGSGATTSDSSSNITCLGRVDADMAGLRADSRARTPSDRLPGSVLLLGDETRRPLLLECNWESRLMRGRPSSRAPRFPAKLGTLEIQRVLPETG